MILAAAHVTAERVGAPRAESGVEWAARPFPLPGNLHRQSALPALPPHATDARAY